MLWPTGPPHRDPSYRGTTIRSIRNTLRGLARLAHPLKSFVRKGFSWPRGWATGWATCVSSLSEGVGGPPLSKVRGSSMMKKGESGPQNGQNRDQGGSGGPETRWGPEAAGGATGTRHRAGLLGDDCGRDAVHPGGHRQGVGDAGGAHLGDARSAVREPARVVEGPASGQRSQHPH